MQFHYTKSNTTLNKGGYRIETFYETFGFYYVNFVTFYLC